jgi:UDP-glucose 4-epimerase
MATILVTGGLGYVGGRLVNALAKQHKVFVSSRKPIDEKDVLFYAIQGGIQHHDLLQSSSFPSNIDIVIHLAALNEMDCVQFPEQAIEVNINHTRIILENAIAKGVQKFIYFSTAHIYGNSKKEVITEDTIPMPTHPYAITHRAAEDYVYAAHLQNKIKTVLIRLSNSFGAPLQPTVNRWTLLVNDLCRQAVVQNKLQLLSNGCQYRDFVCLTDVENIVMQMVNTNEQKEVIYNLGSGNAMQVKEMAILIAEQYQSKYQQVLPIVYPPNVVATKEKYFTYTNERLKKEGYTIKNNITEELSNLLDFCKKHFQR